MRAVGSSEGDIRVWSKALYSRLPPLRPRRAIRLLSPAGDRSRPDGWCRQAARETINGLGRQVRDHRAGAGKFLEGFDPGFRKPDTACGSPVGRALDMNEDARATSRGAIARIVDEETAAVERTTAHVVGLD